jgi:hypothetical protein
MRRREILFASVSSTLAISGCVDAPWSDGDDDTNGVPGCTQDAEWTDTIAAGPADPDTGSIAGRRNCSTATRPEPTGEVCETFVREVENGTNRTVHSVGVRPYPDPPSTFETETLRSFVSAYERAYTQNAAVAEHGANVVEFSFSTIETRTIDRFDTVTGIVIAFGFGYRDERGGYTDSFGNVAVYGVDETGVVRRPEPYGPGEIDPDEVGDPVENGHLLECF